SSSPISIRNGSPVLRKKQSMSSSDFSDLAQRARHSPPLGRSFDPNDPSMRERQRTLDVDMAMQMALARRETISSMNSPFDQPGGEGEHPPFPSMMLSPQEQHELNLAQGQGALADNGEEAEDSAAPKREDSLLDLREQHLHTTQDPDLLVSTSTTPQAHHDYPETLSTAFGLPKYQAATTITDPSQFDFTHLEDFCANERSLLSPGSPRPVFSDPFPKRDADNAGAGVGEASTSGAPPASGPPPPPAEDTITDPGPAAVRPTARHRKLSQSNTPRPHRKGIGGKMAVFEGAAEPSSFSNRLNNILSGRAADAEQSDNNTRAPPPGILTTGHDRPYRFSFYSNALNATIHARSLSELPAEGQSFQDLFSGVPAPQQRDRPSSFSSTDKRPSRLRHPMALTNDSEANTWWLDVMNPTDEEMRILSKVFSIHPLTTEDIQMEEAREKIELFRNYYLVCFRSFDQDPYSPTHLEPLNMYIIVFREGTLSFHFRPTPHPQNVRRRIKQLKDYISVTSDWISYALIDDITDAFGPLIQNIEYEVDSIDELVLILKEAEQSDMLRRIGTCRKKVMGLLRLMGNKADVVKGLAKRCNENWRVAPTSDIGLYLSDIQDHLITMTQNLNHYEKILSRSHSNYLAQISIEMTDANNQINDVLSKLTALGTVLIPMNLVTGLWGMNVNVPGQE
ncbi:hypothetical protein FB107DRAFT_175173, partial [Schizophyllum commune]